MSVSGALRNLRAEPGPNRRIGRLFMVGSFCFAIASLPGAGDWAPKTAALVYFIGSIFFTAAGAEQLRTTSADDKIDLIASAVQLAGTIAFNLSTYNGLADRLDGHEYDFLVWIPNGVGSIGFLIASGLACWAIRGVHDRRTSWIAWLNMTGSIAFGISAIAAAAVPETDQVLDATVANLFTLVGAVCFLIAAAMLVPRRGARAPEPAPA